MKKLSQKQILYLKKKQREKRLIVFLRILIFLIFLFLWEFSARNSWIDSFIFSSPSMIFRNFIFMLQNQHLVSHIGITIFETIISFSCVVLLSILSAIILWIFPGLANILEPYLIVLNSLPKSALAPLLIVWLGANVRTIIFAGMSVALFGSILNLYTGFKEVDKEKCRLVQTFGGGKLTILQKVVLPSSIPILLSIMKVNIGLCLVGVIIGEFIGARSGLGYLIIYGSQTFKLTWVLMSIVLLCIIAMLLYSSLSIFEKRICKRYVNKDA